MQELVVGHRRRKSIIEREKMREKKDCIMQLNLIQIDLLITTHFNFLNKIEMLFSKRVTLINKTNYNQNDTKGNAFINDNKDSKHKM